MIRCSTPMLSNYINRRRSKQCVKYPILMDVTHCALLTIEGRDSKQCTTTLKLVKGNNVETMRWNQSCIDFNVVRNCEYHVKWYSILQCYNVYDVTHLCKEWELNAHLYVAWKYFWKKRGRCEVLYEQRNTISVLTWTI